MKIPLPSEQKLKIEKLLERLPNYRSTIHCRTASQSTTRKVEETFSRLTTDDLQDLEKTEQGKSAIKLIGRATEGHVLDKNEFATVRDYLLVTVMIENGSRPGPLETAKVSCFERATFVESEEKYTILVDEHKTTRHQGPAELTVDKRIYSYLKIFVNYIRPAFVHSAAEDALFINKNGQQFQKGTIGRRVPEFFQKAGIRTDIRVTPTRVRKFYETASNQSLNTTDQQLVADHLKHEIKTARQNYVEKVNAVKATNAHGVLKSLVHLQSSATTTKPMATEEENQEQTQPDAMDQTIEQKEGLEDEEVSTAGLTPEEKVVVTSVFNDTISQGIILSMAEVRSRMKSEIALRKFLVDGGKVKKVADFVRYNTQTVKQTAPTELPDVFDEYNSISNSSGGRREWNSNDVQVIKSFFATYSQMPHKKQLISDFEQDNVLKYILRREGPQQCYEKVKNLFRKKAAK